MAEPVAPAWLQPAPPAPARVVELARDILERCRGEGPANCRNRCPMDVDARGYVQLTREGRFQEALQLVREQLPFPGVLGYVCEHPCELHCKRLDEDSPVRIRDIKRFLAEWEPGEPQHLLQCEPQRSERVVVVGAGPAGLTAAHDLRRRGYRVTLLDRAEAIGGCLVDKIPAWRLPRAVVARDLSIIEALGIEVRTGVALGRDVTLGGLREEFDAVLLLIGFDGGCELLAQDGGGLRRTARGTLWADPRTGETGLEGVYAGGDAVSGPATVVRAMAMGRRAAESAHRRMAGESPREDRALPGEGRLLWTLEVDDLERQRRMRPPTMMVPALAPMTEDEARAEADRCLDCTCGLCVRDCEFLTKHCSSPRDLARRVLDGLPADDDLRMAYSCNVCSLCAQVCPEHLDTGRMLLDCRREAVRDGRGPFPEHKGIVSYYNAGVGKLFSLLRPAPGRRQSRRLFFTGCSLPAVAPRWTLEVYQALRRQQPDTGVLMYCCGAPVELLGMEEPFAQTRADLLRMAEEVGADELVVACPDCTHTLKANVPELKITTVWEQLALAGWQPPRAREGAVVSIHDSCKAQHEPELQRSVRTLLERSGATVDDVEYRGEKARCCGFGGMIYPVDAALSQSVSRRRADESEHPMITYCAGCRMALRGVGKDSAHILDFLLQPDWEKAAGAKPPGTITRYANRLRTKWALKRLKPLEAE